MTNVLPMLTEDKILILVQPEATMIHPVLSSSLIERYMIQYQETSLNNKKGIIVGKHESEMAQNGGISE